jgi:hypothetical protein
MKDVIGRGEGVRRCIFHDGEEGGFFLLFIALSDGVAGWIIWWSSGSDDDAFYGDLCAGTISKGLWAFEQGGRRWMDGWMVMHMYRLARSLVTPSLIAAGEEELRGGDGWLKGVGDGGGVR